MAMKSPFTEEQNEYLRKVPVCIVETFIQLYPKDANGKLWKSYDKYWKVISSRKNTILRGERKKLSGDRTYEKHFRKRHIQTITCGKIPFSSDALAILGPNCKFSYDMYSSFFGKNCSITSYENDIEVFNKQKLELLSQKNLNLFFGDIRNSEVKRIIDLDLMKKYFEVKDIAIPLFKRQSKLRGRKFFSLTMSINWQKEEKSVSDIETCLYDLLGTSVKITGSKKYSFYHNDKKLYYTQYLTTTVDGYTITVFKYKDSSIMSNINIFKK